MQLYQNIKTVPAYLPVLGCIRLTFIEILLTFDVSIVKRYYD